MGIEELRALRETLRAWDAELRRNTCPVCGRPVSGLVPTGRTAAEVGICTGCHRLDDKAAYRTWYDRLAAVRRRAGELPLPAEARRRVETCLRRSQLAHRAAGTEGTTPDEVERHSRRAWRWLVQAERFLGQAEG